MSISLRENILDSLGDFSSHKVRTFLAVLGVVFGVAALVSMIGIGQGTRSKMLTDMELLGGINIIIVQGPSPEKILLGESHRQRGLLHLSDLDYISKSSAHIEVVAPTVSVYGKIGSDRELHHGQLIGTTPEYLEIRNCKIQNGRFLHHLDVANASGVAVLGAEVAELLFGDRDPRGLALNTEIGILKIIGVMGKLDTDGGGWLNNAVIVPHSFLHRRVYPEGTIEYVFIKIRGFEYVDPVREQVQLALSQNRPSLEGITLLTQEQTLIRVSKSTELLRISFAAIALISLLVGGIGIMNVMLIIVKERTKEIGVRKAVGACKSDLLFRFLLEATVMGAIGGIIGITLGIRMGRAFADYATVFIGERINYLVSPRVVVLSWLFALAVGVLSGLYPAWKAANMDPVDALRYE